MAAAKRQFHKHGGAPRTQAGHDRAATTIASRPPCAVTRVQTCRVANEKLLLRGQGCGNTSLLSVSAKCVAYFLVAVCIHRHTLTCNCLGSFQLWEWLFSSESAKAINNVQNTRLTAADTQRRPKGCRSLINIPLIKANFAWLTQFRCFVIAQLTLQFLQCQIPAKGPFSETTTETTMKTGINNRCNNHNNSV